MRLIALLLAGCLGQAQDLGIAKERLGRIHETVQRHIEDHQIAGAVTLVARRGKVVHLEAQGLFDVETKKAMGTGDVFRIWSMSKPVAAVAILMLMEEGKVRLNDPVSRFIPEFRGVGNPREITVQDLLTHVSGLGSDPATSVSAAVSLRKGADGIQDIVPRYAGTGLAFAPGTRWAYSPVMGFDVLGRIVEVAAGVDFQSFLKTRLFEPLGMKNTFFHPGEAGWPRVVSSYHRRDGKLEKTASPNGFASTTYFSGAGGLMSTAEDYLQFAEMLLEGGALKGKRILSPRTVELMRSVFVPDTLPGRPPGIGFGLSVQVVSDPVLARQRVSKGSYGWDGAYGTHFWIDPVEKIVGILMIQTDNPNRQLDRDFENAVMQAVIE